MRKLRNSITTPSSAPTNNTPITPLRRSPRLLHQTPQDLNTVPPKPSKTLKKSAQKPSKKACAKSLPPETPLRRSPRLSSISEGISDLRRSSRLSLLGNISGHDGSKKRSDIRSKKIRHSSSVESEDTKGDFLNKVKQKVGVGSCDKIARKSERTQCCVDVKVVCGLGAMNRTERNQETRVTRKRKRGEKANKESVKGWTKEQEMALQRAYIVVKPTPNFWKRVSKLVPGKSAKDCFDRVHSDHMTPVQPLPRSRAKKMDSPLGCFSLSASGLLGSASVKVKRLSRYKQKSHIAHKTARQLLQKHTRLDLNCEADLFSVLEPDVNPSEPDSELNNIVSTPKKQQQKQGFLQQCHERSSQEKKSRFRTSNEIDILSPPVLKQVKNRALHEKYIDQLHCRDAKRKTACAAGKENSSQANIPKTDMVRAAKNALVSDAADAINTLQHLHTGDSSDGDDDHLETDDDENEDL
ncbi:uncharacterized protein [Euphorbia lathyris]|uniref:uncharacterized protein n=1 Tax=Euphorbia lathyris TaxID=212925 RepID=UPI003314416E